MTLNASGYLGIGQTSPTTPLDVSGNNAVARFNSVDANGNYIAFASNGTIRAYIGNGNQIISGGSTNDWAVRAENNLLFAAGGGTERMRLDSTGNLLVGLTSVGGTISCVRKGNTYNIYAQSDANNSAEGYLVGFSSATGSNRVIIYSNGNIVNANNSYGAISDIKLKENIVDATPKLEQLCQVKVRNYNLIGDSNKQLGVVAQELEQVFPRMIDESPDRDAEGNDLGTTTKQVKYSVFVPMLIKAIQEQQAIINDLKARIETLESK
jgi:hypothetical protein